MLRSLILTIPLALLALTAARGHIRGHLVVGKSSWVGGRPCRGVAYAGGPGTVATAIPNAPSERIGEVSYRRADDRPALTPWHRP
jgi:hypothetical protein